MKSLYSRALACQWAGTEQRKEPIVKPARIAQNPMTRSFAGHGLFACAAFTCAVQLWMHGYEDRFTSPGAGDV